MSNESIQNSDPPSNSVRQEFTGQMSNDGEFLTYRRTNGGVARRNFLKGRVQGTTPYKRKCFHDCKETNRMCTYPRENCSDCDRCQKYCEQCTYCFHQRRVLANELKNRQLKSLEPDATDLGKSFVPPVHSASYLAAATGLLSYTNEENDKNKANDTKKNDTETDKKDESTEIDKNKTSESSKANKVEINNKMSEGPKDEQQLKFEELQLLQEENALEVALLEKKLAQKKIELKLKLAELNQKSK